MPRFDRIKYCEFNQKPYPPASAASKIQSPRQLLDAEKGLPSSHVGSDPQQDGKRRIFSHPPKETLKQILFHGLNAFQEAHEVKRFRHVFVGSKFENFVAISFRNPSRDDDNIGGTALRLLA